ncbi:MAG: amidohydrolase/deacetylase family metallohydrolase [Balneolales bacterium]
MNNFLALGTLPTRKSFIKLNLMLVFAALCITIPALVQAQNYDLVIKGGRMIDPKNNIDAPMDIAVNEGIIARVASNIPGDSAERVVDANGLIVTPGLIDMHVHVNRYTPRGLDGYTFRAGVTTVVDGGTFGWRYFHMMQEYLDNSQTRVLAFIDIVGSKGTPHINSMTLVLDPSDRDPAVTASMINRNSDVIVGIKTWKAPSFEGIEQAVEAGDMADVPVMIDFGSSDPLMSLERLLLDVFRPGDIYTHAYAYHPNTREAIVDENYRVEPHVLAARERGIIFDVGHGGGAFSFEGAIPAVEQGFLPDVISTDLHWNSMNGGAKDMANMMSKFLAMGMSLQPVIEASTWTPAQVIQREELGHLSEGAEADIAVFSLREGDFGFLDVRNKLLKGTRKLEAELTLRAGEVVWDLNGLAGDPVE